MLKQMFSIKRINILAKAIIQLTGPYQL